MDLDDAEWDSKQSSWRDPYPSLFFYFGSFYFLVLAISLQTLFHTLTQVEMNMASSRSHCIYIFMVQQESTMDKRYYFFLDSV